MDLKGKKEQIAAAEETNGFGIPIVTGVDEVRVYPSKFGTGKNTTVATVRLPIASIGLSLVATIYGRLDEKPEGSTLTYEPSFGRNVKGNSPDDMAEAKSFALSAAMAWPGWVAAELAAEKALTQGPQPLKAKKGGADLVPRLTKAVKVVAVERHPVDVAIIGVADGRVSSIKQPAA